MEIRGRIAEITFMVLPVSSVINELIKRSYLTRTFVLLKRHKIVAKLKPLFSSYFIRELRSLTEYCVATDPGRHIF